jgi:hypothetical protein
LAQVRRTNPISIVRRNNSINDLNPTSGTIGDIHIMRYDDESLPPRVHI